MSPPQRATRADPSRQATSYSLHLAAACRRHRRRRALRFLSRGSGDGVLGRGESLAPQRAGTGGQHAGAGYYGGWWISRCACGVRETRGGSGHAVSGLVVARGPSGWFAGPRCHCLHCVVCSLRRNLWKHRSSGAWGGGPASSTRATSMVVETRHKLDLEVVTASLRLAEVWNAPSTDRLGSMWLGR